MKTKSHQEPRKERENKKRKEEEMYRWKVHQPLPLLEYLIYKLPSCGRNKIKNFLVHRQVLVDGMVVTRHDFMLANEDVVTILKQGRKIEKKEKFPLEILYEDEDFIVINKPSGLLSIASDHEKEKTAYRMLNDYVRQSDPKQRIFILHRIDKDTSGILVVAKNVRVRDSLQKRWNDFVQERGYYAIIPGTLPRKEGTFHTWLLETTTNLMYSSHKKGEGQEAITHYRTMETNSDYSLLDVHIDTGRKNQIRVHLKEAGHPILGDEKYGNGEDPLHRLALHAYQLTFLHPITKKKMSFTSPMPKEFRSLFQVAEKKKKS